MIGNAELQALLPMLVLSGTIILVMLAIAVRRHHGLTAALSAAGLIGALAMLPLAAERMPLNVTPLLVIDGYALFFQGLMLAAGLAVVLLSHDYLRRFPGPREEYYLLVLLGVLGAMVLVSARHFAAFFLGLEVLSVSLFVLVAYPAARRRPLEAGFKYLILAGLSSALLLFGMALIYARTGSLAFAGTGLRSLLDPYLLAGLALIAVGVGFKLSLVPFHLWTPDIYEGAPAPVTALVATLSKGAMFALLLRYFVSAGLYANPSVVTLLTVIAVASMLGGNLLALLQDNVKRLLAYSSIAHLGYLLVALLALGSIAPEAVAFYLVAYFITMLGALGVVGSLSPDETAADKDHLNDYQGLFWRCPWTAGVLTLMLLSLAGIPLTAGFVAKVYVLGAGVQASLWLPVYVLIAGSVIGLFYYLRVIVYMFMPQGRTGSVASEPARLKAGPGAAFVLSVLTAALVWIGVYPQILIGLITGTAG